MNVKLSITQRTKAGLTKKLIVAGKYPTVKLFLLFVLSLYFQSIFAVPPTLIDAVKKLEVSIGLVSLCGYWQHGAERGRYRRYRDHFGGIQSFTCNG